MKKISQYLSLLIAGQIAFSSTVYGAAGGSFYKATQIMQKQMAELGPKAGTIRPITTTDSAGKAVRGILVDGGKFGQVVIQETQKMQMMKEWNKFKVGLAPYLKKRNSQNEAIKRGFRGGETFMSDVALKMGPETLSFFIALGSIQVVKMILEPGMSPLGTYQELDSQRHPITHISFAAFMYGSGAISPILQMVEKPWFRPYIPYLGMSAGMIASDLTHRLSDVMSGRLEQCRLDLEKQIKDIETVSANCDRAFESWSEYSIDAIVEMVPAVASLIASTMAAGTFEKHVSNRVLVKMGFGALLHATPVGRGIGWGVKFGQFTVRTLGNVIPFTVASEIIGNPIAHSIKSILKTTDINRSQVELVETISAANASDWQGEKGKQAVEAIYKTNKELRAWRKLNLEKVEAAYSSWLLKVSELSANYNLSEFLYSQFVSKTEPSALSIDNQILMRRPAPLFGVTQKETAESPAADIYGAPRNVMLQQLEHIVDVGTAIENLENTLAGGNYKLYFDSEETLLGNEIKQLNSQLRGVGGTDDFGVEDRKNRIVLPAKELLKKLFAKSIEIKKLAETALSLSDSVSTFNDFYKATISIGQKLNQLNEMAGLKNLYPGLAPGSFNINRSTPTDPSTFAKQQFAIIFRSLYGEPFPIMQNGGLFFAALESRSEVRSNSLAMPALSKAEGIHALRPVQKIFVDMFLGPEFSDMQNIYETKRWKLPGIQFGQSIAIMNPPRLSSAKPNLQLKTVPPALLQPQEALNTTVFNTPVEVDGVTYPNFYEYALKTWNQRATVKDAKELENIWAQKINIGYQKALAELEPFYEEMLSVFMNTIRAKTKNIDNSGDLHNGNLAQIDMEKKFYLMTLGESLRGLKLADSEFEAPVALLPVVKTRQNNSPFLGLLASLDNNSNLVLKDHMANNPGVKGVQWTESHPKQNLKLQSQISKMFVNMARFLDGNVIRFENKKLVSFVSNSDIVSQRDEIQKKLTAWAALEEEPIPGVKAQLTGERRRAYTLSLNSLKLLIGELANYALMVNELSYIRSEGNPGRSGNQDPECIMTATSGAKKGANGTSHAQFDKKCAK